ncbi:oligosaccharide flippase family protein [Chryseobacterium indoltheticum]|uniref:oligosaccharide flippase family protein n=1 Tax=Chryseobacterium indoltheticum TaxID=254 RepID=UPI0028E4AC8E|nr:oligosaccharide flippase family protein [Chryseobacterium indoltheticum]
MKVTMLLKSQLLKDSIWAVIGSVVLRGLSMFSGIFIARMLGSETYGAFTTLKGFLLTITVFSTLGLGYSSTKFFAEHLNVNTGIFKSLYRYVMKITLFFSVFFSFLLFFFSDYYASNFLKDDGLSYATKILAISIVFNALSFTQVGVISGLKKFKKLSVLNLIVGIFSFAGSLGLTYYFGFLGSVYSLLFVSILNFVLNEIFLSREWKNMNCDKNSIDIAIKKSIKQQTFPIALQEISYAVAAWLGPLLLIKYSNYSDVANYNIVMQWNAIILFIPGALRNVILSYLVTANNENSADNQWKIMKKTIALNVLTTLCPAIVIYFARFFIVDLYGSQYAEVATLISLAVFITVPLSVSNIYAQAFMSLNKNWMMLILRAIRDFSILLFFTVLIIKYKVIPSKAMLLSNLIISSFFLIIIMSIYTYLFQKKK